MARRCAWGGSGKFASLQSSSPPAPLPRHNTPGPRLPPSPAPLLEAPHSQRPEAPLSTTPSRAAEDSKPGGTNTTVPPNIGDAASSNTHKFTLLATLMANWTRLFRNLRNMIAFFSEAWFLGRPSWTPDKDMSDLTGKVVIVTGGSSGLGLDTARALLKRNARVYIATRSEHRARAAIGRLENDTGRRAGFLKLDLADLESVKSAVDEFKSKESQLDVLYNNAALLTTTIDDVVDGYDSAMYTNVLGPFYLTQLLLPLLLHTSAKTHQITSEGRTPPQSTTSTTTTTTTAVPSRIVNMTSSAHHLASTPILDFNSFKDGPGRRKYAGDIDHFYTQSKAAVIMFSNELARRYGPERGVISIAVNPGNFRTALTRNVDDFVRVMFQNWLLYLYPSEWGCITQLWAGTAPQAVHLNGKYLIPWGRQGRPRVETSDPILSRELWLWLEEQVRMIQSRNAVGESK